MVDTAATAVATTAIGAAATGAARSDVDAAVRVLAEAPFNQGYIRSGRLRT